MTSREPSTPGLLRALARQDPRFAREAERLARLSPGGAPGHPIVLASASQVEVHAEGMLCPVCQGEQRVEDHTAETIGGARLRVAAVFCKHCGFRRRVYFRLKSSRPS
jgi:hypothetical protein